jgi:GNAT superfamily N-acetyltransferase
MNWIFRPAVDADAAGLSELAERTFRDAFSELNTAENMDLYCASAFSPAVQAAEIANADIRTVVAESDGRLVAFAQVHLRSNPPGCVPVSPSVELRRIYVERSFHGAGLARDLMAHVLDAAVAHGAAVVWLGVWEHNPRAIRFYQGFGFSDVGDHVFVVGADPQRDLVMVRSLNA